MKFHAAVQDHRRLPLPLVFGHFLPWYTLNATDYPLEEGDTANLEVIPQIENQRHWSDTRSDYRRTHLHLPEIGPYDSRDPRVIAWQIEQALDHGLCGFIVNWYGKHSVENLISLSWLRGLRAWNEAHPERSFLYFFSIDAQSQRPTEGKAPVSIEEDLRYVKDHLMGDAYLHRDGRPVFSVFPYEENAAAWRAGLDAVFGSPGADLIWMNGAANEGENAAYPWIRPDPHCVDPHARTPWTDPGNIGMQWLQEFYAGVSRAGLDYLMAGVWPGFDDTLVRWAWNPASEGAALRPRVMCRETRMGNTMELTWSVYLDYVRRWAQRDSLTRVAAPLVQVVTWNDYAEGSTVEPTRDYGQAPLTVCRAMIAEAQAIWRSARQR